MRSLTVAQVLELLAGGMSFEEILEDYPYLEKEDILACLEYADQGTSLPGANLEEGGK